MVSTRSNHVFDTHTSMKFEVATLRFQFQYALPIVCIAAAQLVAQRASRQAAASASQRVASRRFTTRGVVFSPLFFIFDFLRPFASIGCGDSVEWSPCGRHTPVNLGPRPQLLRHFWHAP